MICCKIVEGAKSWPADLIVIGSHGRGALKDSCWAVSPSRWKPNVKLFENHMNSEHWKTV